MLLIKNAFPIKIDVRKKMFPIKKMFCLLKRMVIKIVSNKKNVPIKKISIKIKKLIESKKIVFDEKNFFR